MTPIIIDQKMFRKTADDIIRRAKLNGQQVIVVDGKGKTRLVIGTIKGRQALYDVDGPDPDAIADEAR